MNPTRVARFSEIDSRLRRLLGDERGVQVDFLLCLEEFDRAKGYEDLEYATLWDYCRRELGLLDCAIARRVQSMRILRKFPRAEAYLRDGRLCMTGIGMLEKVFTEDNHVEILDRASRKSTREISEISVESNAPVPETALLRMIPRAAPRTRAAPLDPTTVTIATPTPSRTLTPTDAATDRAETIALAFATEITTAANEPEPSAVLAPGTVASPKQRVVQVSPRQFRLTLVVSEEFKAKVDRVKKILSHRVPDGNLETVLAAALDLVIAKDDKRNKPTTKKGGTGEATAARSLPALERRGVPRGAREHIPAEVARAVWVRDGGRCCWRLATGESCGSEFQVQHDHEIPVAHGGRSILSNLRLLCAAHNRLAARRALGDALMAKYRKKRV